MTDSQQPVNLPLVFLDIDGTLLDSDYNTNDPLLPQYINSLQTEKGFVFGLNSNQSLEDIIPIAKQFSISGPLIGENGVFAYSLATGTTDLFLKPSQLREISKNKMIIEQLINKALRDYFNSGRIMWRDVDTVHEISHHIIEADFKEDDIVVLNNKYRKYTVSAHLFRLSNGRLRTIAVREVKNVLELVRCDCDKYDLTVTYNPYFSNILVYTNKVSKQTAVKQVLGKYPNMTLYFIGDDISDYCITKDIGNFLAVKNAPIKVIRKALFSSSVPNALGVRELLGRIT